MIARPIVADSTNNGRAQPADIIFQNLESFMVAVAGNDSSPVLHELREIGCFAARCRARIEDLFSWFRIEKLTRDCCAGVLNVAATRIESGRW
jgi:hypothetical protein